MRELQANWDSYGAASVDLRSIRLAKSLVTELAKIETVEAPTVTATSTGNVAFCWDDGERSLDVEVRSDGLLEFAYLNESQPTWDKEGVTCEVDDLAVLLTNI